MACEECRKVQETEDKDLFYRWKKADILIVACEKHTKEIIKVLNDYQKEFNIKKYSVKF